MRIRFVKCVVLGLLLLALCPAMTWAQSAFTGVVTDASGGVLPGVTVEASSPALIEKVRNVVTDGEGRFTIVDLRPGSYSVTFTLPGFSVVKRDGIDLPADFTATVNAELRVGAVEETITVTGQSPVVDTHTTQKSDVLKREVIDALPLGRGYRSVALILPGITGGGQNRPMVGDQSVPPSLATQGGSTFDMTQLIDGVLLTTLMVSSFHPYNDALIQESTYQSAALTPETSRGGVRVNLIPRDGGNTFDGGSILNFSHGSWQASNITPELRARNLREANRLAHTVDFNPWISGPIKQDSVWFFGSYRYQELQNLPASTAQGYGYGAIGGTITNYTGRVTWQATTKNKFSVLGDWIERPFPTAAIEDPGASTRHKSLYYYALGKWSSPVTNRVLLEAGTSWNQYGYRRNGGFYGYDSEGNFLPPPRRGTPEWFASAGRLDLATGIRTVAPGDGVGITDPRMISVNGSLSYVTGSHNIKIGVQDSFGSIYERAEWNADLFQIYNNRVPAFVDIAPSPIEGRQRVTELGVYAQDSWTIRRLTLNGGVRFDYLNSSSDAISIPAGRFVPARNFPEVRNLPKFTDVAPRLGMSYDVFGDGRTAIKASVSKYMSVPYPGATGGIRQYVPSAGTASVLGTPRTDRRDWRDLNGDNIAQENEIGPSNNLGFAVAPWRRLDPNVKREYSIEYTANVQHEFLPGYSASASFIRRPYSQSLAAINEAVSPSDYVPFQVASPLNNGETITIYNLNRAKQGQVDIIDRTSDINTRKYTGLHFTVNGRLPRGGTLLVGWSTERNATVTCDTSDPNQLRFCDQTGELHQAQGAMPAMPFIPSYRVLGTFPGLPFAVGASLAIRGFSGDPLVNNWVVPATVFPGGQRTQAVTVPLIAPTEFLPGWSQVDLGVKRTFAFGRTSLLVDLTIFNVMNSNTVITQTSTFGPAWGTPTLIIPGRLPRVGLQLSF